MLFLKKTKNIFRFFSFCIFLIVRPKNFCTGSYNILIFFFCLKEHQKMHGLTVSVFWLNFIFYYIYNNYVNWRPFFDHFLTSLDCRSFFPHKSDEFKKKETVNPCILRRSFEQKKNIHIVWAETEFWAAKWAIFDPCWMNISLTAHSI
jgi:hypothetical protein